MEKYILIDKIRQIQEFASSFQDECHFVTDCDMSLRCSFHVGGTAALALFPCNQKVFVSLLRELNRTETEYRIIGNGTNIVPPDGRYDGVVVYTTKMEKIAVFEEYVTADCGASLNTLIRACLRAGSAGIETLYGIPGSVGGGIYMNAGAFGTEFSQFIRSTQCYDTISDEIRTIEGDALEFGYRTSVYHKNRSLVILSADISLTPGDTSSCASHMKEIAAKRRASQPLDFPSAGSVFKRPAGNFAGKLIEEAGLKGMRVGGAEVSEKHAGFIINRGSATASDVYSLVEKVRSAVKEHSGVTLECEIEFL